MNWYNRINTKTYVITTILLFVVLLGSLIYQGHIPICECGYVLAWNGEVNTANDSQHLADWYTFSHIIHGFVFFWLIRVIFRKKLPVEMALLIALGIEIGWEILENSPIIINRYRETAATMYFGDSIFNSVADVLWMMLGFLFAYKFPTWLSVAIVVFFELFVLYFIKDNLVLNIIMLLHPFDAIKSWQMGS